MPSAFVARSARWQESMAQPTTRRDQASMTTQQYTLPSRVGCSVIPVTHSWLGPVRRKSRRTRPVTVTSFPERLPREGAGKPARPARRISRLTVLCPTVMPCPQVQLGVHPGCTLGAAGGLMDGADQAGQPGLADRPRRRRPPGPGVIPRPPDPEGMAGPPGPHTSALSPATRR
jgi:hypothetical protein